MKNSLESMRLEIENQPDDLQSFANILSGVARPLDPSSLFFAGSGDSYSAAVWAQELSDGKTVAHDPFELALHPSRAKDKHVFILSVTGRTRANILLAERLRVIASRRTAVTGSIDNPLTKECDDTLLLEYHRRGVLTAGTASYTATLLVCSHLLGHMPVLELGDVLRAAKKDVENNDPSFHPDGTVVFVGSGLDYPLAMYGGLKFNEVLGTKSFPCTPEQLVHAIIFSLDPERDWIVMIDPVSNNRRREVKDMLSETGFHVYSLNVASQNPVVRSFETAFHLQYLAYSLAIRAGLTECAFLSNKKTLEVSSRLIY